MLWEGDVFSLRQRYSQAIIGLCSASLFLIAMQTAAPADPVYMELGGYLPSNSPSSGAIAFTDQIVQAPGVTGQVSAFIPILDGRYGLTAEVRTPEGGHGYFGVGAGIGKLNIATGFIVDAIGGLPVYGPLSIGFRFYASTSKGVGTGGFAGLRLRL